VDADFMLIEKWRAGDQGAEHEILSRHFAEVFRFLESKVRGEGSELVQRTFLACLRAQEPWHGPPNVRTYLFAAARRELYRYLGQVCDEPVDFEVTSLSQLAVTPPARAGRELEHVRAALSELPLDQQLALELDTWHGLDAADIGVVFDASPAGARTTLARARRGLRERLDGRLGDGDTRDSLVERMVAAARASDDLD
jgi:RNA polymerase sigma-70 factor, ECF subfamily